MNSPNCSLIDWKTRYNEKLSSLEDAAKIIKSGDLVYSSGGPSAPYPLLNAIGARYKELKNVNVVTAFYMRPVSFLAGECRGHINYHSIFQGPLERMFKPQGNVTITSAHFSGADEFFLRKECDVALMECSAPDERGYMSYGPTGCFSNDTFKRMAKKIIVQVNREVPFCFGTQAHIHVSEVDVIVEHDEPVPEVPNVPMGDIENLIAGHAAELIPDGSTIQIGIGKFSNAVGYMLKDRKDIGIYTEMISDSMMSLAKSGVATGARKNFHPGKITASMVMGTAELYQFVDQNPMVELYPVSWINNLDNISANDNFVSINNALAVDLTGQVASETLGFDTVSGIGGSTDFVRGARRSRGGKSLILLKSTTKTKEGELISKITLSHTPGTVVSVLRADTDWIITEYGAVNLWQKPLPERTRLLISIAHPDFRDQLTHEAKKAGLFL